MTKAKEDHARAVAQVCRDLLRICAHNKVPPIVMAEACAILEAQLLIEAGQSFSGYKRSRVAVWQTAQRLVQACDDAVRRAAAKALDP